MGIKIEKIVPGGQGLGTLKNGKKVFLWNALPGEVVEEWEVTKKKSSYEEGIVTKISEVSPERVEPRDACYLSTSPWQIMRYEYELRLKGEVVKECFRQEGVSVEAPEVVTDGKEWGYRNKMEYALYWDNEEAKIKLAFHERGSHRKVPITQSSIERPEVYGAAVKIVLELNERREEARKYQSLLLRTSQNGNVSGGLYENGKAHPVFPPLTDNVMGREYKYSPNGFFQINLPVYEMALSEISRAVSGATEVLDLYSGVGTIGLSVAAPNAKLTLVECDKACVEEMRNNISEFPNARAVLARSEEVLEYVNPLATVIVDPPRAGCDKKLISRFLEVMPSKIVYLSCNPITQARDVSLLVKSGDYIIDDIKAFNFFPKTPHIENLVVLKRR